tara:strand:+ start:532 stop:834 length:303 start_codon:yes stop_codon:yes gene_type:complete
MSFTKRYLEDISQTIGFCGEINERVHVTSRLLDDMLNSYNAEGDCLHNNSSIGWQIQQARNELKGLKYYHEPKLYFSKLNRLLTRFTFEELLAWDREVME